METPHIGLIGRKRTGKDAAAATLTRSFGYVRRAYADPLKSAALGLDPIVNHTFTGRSVRLGEVVDLYGWEYAKDNYPEVRRTLQRLGTEAIRSLDDGFWLGLMSDRLAEADAADEPLVVTDCRFPNEADLIREAGGVIVRVTRPDLADDGDAHVSETALDDYEADYTVVNHGTLADLDNNVRILAGLLAD